MSWNPFAKGGFLKKGGTNNPLNWAKSDWHGGFEQAAQTPVARYTGISNLRNAALESYRGAYQGNTNWKKVAQELGTGVGKFGLSTVPVLKGAQAGRGAMAVRSALPAGKISGKLATGGPGAKLAGSALGGFLRPLGGGVMTQKGRMESAARLAAAAAPGSNKALQLLAGGAGALAGAHLVRDTPSWIADTVKNWWSQGSESPRLPGAQASAVPQFPHGQGPMLNGVPLGSVDPRSGAVFQFPVPQGPQLPGNVINEDAVTPGASAEPGRTRVDPATGTQLPLSPFEQAMFDQARIDALERFNLNRSSMDLQRRGSSMQTQEALREAGRMGATAATDLQASAAETGFGSSPAAYGVGLEEIAMEEARRKMGQRAQQTAMEEQLRLQAAENKSQYEKYLRDLTQREVQARVSGGFSNVQGRYGI
jgi:hypothetical protein